MKKYLINLSILLGGAGLIAGGIAAAVLVHSPKADGGSDNWWLPPLPRTFENISNSLEQKSSKEDYQKEYLASVDEQIKFFQNELFWKEQQKTRFNIEIKLKEEEKKEVEKVGKKDKAKTIQDEIDKLDKRRDGVGSTYTIRESLKHLVEWKKDYEKSVDKEDSLKTMTFRQWITGEKKKKWDSVKSDYKILIDDLEHIRDESKKIVEDQKKQVVNKWISSDRSSAEWKTKLWKDFNASENDEQAIEYKVFEKIRDINRKRVQYKIVDTYSINDLISLNWDLIKKEIFKFDKDDKPTDDSLKVEDRKLTTDEIYNKYLVHKEFWQLNGDKITLKPYITLDKDNNVINIFGNNTLEPPDEDRKDKSQLEYFDLMKELQFKAVKKAKTKEAKKKDHYEYMLSITKKKSSNELLKITEDNFLYKNYKESDKNKKKVYFFGTESKQENHKILNEPNLKKLWKILDSQRLLKVQKYLLGFKPKKDFAGFEAPEDADFNVFTPFYEYEKNSNHINNKYIWDYIKYGLFRTKNKRWLTKKALEKGSPEKDNKRINKNGSMGIKPFYKYWEQDKNKEFALGLLSHLENQDKELHKPFGTESLDNISEKLKELAPYNNSHKSRLANIDKETKNKLSQDIHKEFLLEKEGKYKEKFDLINDARYDGYKLIIDENGINILNITTITEDAIIKEIRNDLLIASAKEKKYEPEGDYPELFKSVFTEYSNFNYLKYIWKLNNKEQTYIDNGVVDFLENKHKKTIREKKEMDLIAGKDNKKLEEISKRKNLLIDPKEDRLSSWNYNRIFSKFWQKGGGK